MRLSLLALLWIAGGALAQSPVAPPIQSQTSSLPHPLTISPPAQPPVVLNPLPPQERVDLRTGNKEGSKLCTREVFVPCADERARNCMRNETYRCD